MNTRGRLEFVAGAILVVFSLWNIWVFDKTMSDLPPQNSEEIVVREKRYIPIRDALMKAGYRNKPVGFITNRDVKSQLRIPADDYAWSQGQYVMIPWILLRDGRGVSGHEMRGVETPFVIGDFWDGPPSEVPDGLSKIYESEGLMLFQRTMPR